MAYFLPGQIIQTVPLQDTIRAVVRYPKWEDLDQMVSYSNGLSQEDIYLTYSGETITREGEMYYLAEVFKGMEREDNIYLGCYVENTLIGSCTISRDLISRKRSYHVGVFGITIAKEFRSMGLGYSLAHITINQARKRIPGLKILTLNVYNENSIALRLYKKLGFREAGSIPSAVWYRGTYIDEIKMYKKLT